MPLYDLFVAKAIENASNGALSCLIRNQKLDLDAIVNTEGNELLHLIAQYPRVEGYLKTATTGCALCGRLTLSVFARFSRERTILDKRGSIFSYHFQESPSVFLNSRCLRTHYWDMKCV
jgi:hypothetical protein